MIPNRAEYHGHRTVIDSAEEMIAMRFGSLCGCPGDILERRQGVGMSQRLLPHRTWSPDFMRGSQSHTFFLSNHKERSFVGVEGSEEKLIFF